MHSTRPLHRWSFSANFYSIILMALICCGVTIAIYVTTNELSRFSLAVVCSAVLLVAAVQCYRMRLVCRYSKEANSWVLYVRHTIGATSAVVLRDVASAEFTPNWTSYCFASVLLNDGSTISIPCLHGLGAFKNGRINRRAFSAVGWIEELIIESRRPVVAQPS